MTVQVQPAKPKDQFNGLEALEGDLLGDHEQEVVAVVTYGVAKVVDDLKKEVQYPVLYIKSIEPVRGDLEAKALELRADAYEVRTGEGQLDFTGLVSDGGDDE